VRSNAARITYLPHSDTTPEGELNALANVYRFILECQARKNTAGVSSTDDAKETRDGNEERKQKEKHVSQN
jgi:hypothetical protein